jgi:hypothetical protein
VRAQQASAEVSTSEVADRVERTLIETGGASSVDLPPRSGGPVARAWSWALVGALVVAVAGFGVFLLARGQGPDEPSGAAPPPVRGGATAAAPANSADAALVSFELEVTTPGARAFLDEMAITPLPFSAKLERGGKARALRVEAPGYVPQSRIFVLDKDVAIKIELVEEPEELQRPGPDATTPVGRPVQRPSSTPSTPAPASTGKPASTSVADPRNPWGKKKTP